MLNAFISMLAQEEVTTVAGETSEAATTNAQSPWGSIIMIVAMIAIFYFLMIRPQQKKQKEMRKFREGLKVGDRVITAGGIHGKISAVKEDTFTISIDQNVNIKVDKGSVYPLGTKAEEVAADKNK